MVLQVSDTWALTRKFFFFLATSYGHLMFSFKLGVPDFISAGWIVIQDLFWSQLTCPSPIFAM